MKHISLEDTALFLLIAIISLALASFSSGINEHIATTSFQQAQVISALSQQEIISQEEPLVLLVANPGIVASGEAATLSWTISSNSVARCAAVSEPLDELWYGEKDATEGIHTQETSVLTENTAYIIQCIDENDRTSISNMSVTVTE